MKLLLLVGEGVLAFCVNSVRALAHDCGHDGHGNGYYGCDHCGSPTIPRTGAQSKKKTRPIVSSTRRRSKEKSWRSSTSQA